MRPNDLRHRWVCLLMFFFAAFAVAGEKPAVSKPPPAPVPSLTPKFAASFEDLPQSWYVMLPHQGRMSDHGVVIAALEKELAAQKIKPEGALVGIYYSNPLDVPEREMRWELGFRLPRARAVKAPLVLRRHDPQRIARSEHAGPYEMIADTVMNLYDWIARNDHEIAGPMMERFAAGDPARVTPAELRAEVWFPVVSKKKANK